MSIQRVRDLKKLGDYQDILNYLNNICKSRDNISFIKEFDLCPTTEKRPYIIVDINGFLHKTGVNNFLRRSDNNYTLHTCLTPIELIKHRISLVHGNTLSLVEDTNTGTKLYNGVELHCPVHGNFLTTDIQGIFNGRGCPKCSDKRVRDNNRKGLDFYINNFTPVHGDRYNYIELIRHKNKGPEVSIECKEHGVFIQSAQSHRRGSGCPQCALQKHSDNNVGWSITDWVKASNRSKDFDSFKLYIIECIDEETDEKFYKVGRTFYTVKGRFNNAGHMPYKYEILNIVGSTNPEFIFKLENEIKRDMKEYKYLPKKSFGGMRECFNKKPILDEYIHKF